jgi:hypothetical protein
LHPALNSHVRDTEAKLLEEGQIRPSRSASTAGVILTRKKDGSYRYYIDYRRLNNMAVPDAYPMPRVVDAFAAMAGSRLFFTFNMTSGYWQVPMAEKDKPLPDLVTEDGLYEWTSCHSV